MSNTNTTTTDAATESAPNPVQISWPISMLASPAVAHIGDRCLPAPARVALSCVINAAAFGLEHTLHRDVGLDLSDDAAPPDTHRVAYAVSFTCSALEAESTLVFDTDAARAIVDTLSRDLANLSGDGPLTQSETGLLEYAILSCTDQMLRSPIIGGASLTLECFHDAPSAAAALASRTYPGLSFTLRVGGRRGTLHLCHGPLSMTSAQLAVLPTQVSEGHAPRTALPIVIHVALPAIPVAREELEAMEADDVLLLGCRSLNSFAADCRLVTPTGWQLSTAQIEHDTADALTVRCGRLAPAVCAHIWRAPIPDRPLIQPLIGVARLSGDQLARWQEGASIDLRKETPVPVHLLCGRSRIGGGELVTIDEELGIRVIEILAG